MKVFLNQSVSGMGVGRRGDHFVFETKSDLAQRTTRQPDTARQRVALLPWRAQLNGANAGEDRVVKGAGERRGTVDKESQAVDREVAHFAGKASDSEPQHGRNARFVQPLFPRGLD